jgi:hypothetical protein
MKLSSNDPQLSKEAVKVLIKKPPPSFRAGVYKIIV